MSKQKTVVKQRRPEFQATVWDEYGDHDEVVLSQETGDCSECGRPMIQHGVLRGDTPLCPGDVVMEYEDSAWVEKAADFDKHYEDVQ